ncbi:GNAT family N-acetyltransferase [Microbacterium gorillae]|uniref:GNAT family N-acetyltransferase n=1 Tax=Microbacterium gorillae TaxID=1231063 RepID=UPI00058F41D3|nr:GNAT family protein [Microbacterium gorillae]
MDGPLRLLTLDDAPAMADLYAREAEFLAPWDPARDAEWATTAVQRTTIARQLSELRAGRSVPFGIVVDGELVGRLNLSGIMLGPARTANLGYFVAQSHNGRGLATAAVRAAAEHAFRELRLHRLQAATLPENAPSQRVLAKAGFERIGFAPSYLHINGAWRDHVLFQLVAPE